ncbi:hypothetical protein M513_13628 [Trichuris suis]|uniref:Uncharacterized protein n=1 Tax=Trichuris suis TaxID=68888 RepID=A0A085LKJ3_9BILA|nr:hypothetical protein M513_14337 [Trichuris suis]KFD45489.1 hypothetical protein M513_13628 [Trichuris suis]
MADWSFGRLVVGPTGHLNDLADWPLSDRSFGRTAVWRTVRLADLSFGRQVVFFERIKMQDE